VCRFEDVLNGGEFLTCTRPANSVNEGGMGEK
jgi:hypothetical protein